MTSTNENKLLSDIIHIYTLALHVPSVLREKFNRFIVYSH